VGTDLSLWLKADAITGLSDGGLVTIWPDNSGNGYDLSYSIQNSTRPTWQSDAGNAMNGFPVVAFDGVDDFLAESSGTPRNSSFTGFAVTKLSGVSDNDGIFLSAPGAPDAVDFKLRTSGGCAGQYALSASSISSPEELCGGAFSFVDPSLLAYRYASGDFESWQNGAFVASTSVAGGWLADLGQYTLGIDRNQSDLFNGNLPELIIYTGALNNAQRRIVENYLAAKYDLPLAAGDVYVGDTATKGDFDFDVAGIGNEANGSHLAAPSAGLTLSAAPGELGTGDYVLAGHRVQSNSVVTTSLPAGVEARWEREWFVDGGGHAITITFNAADGGLGYLGSDYSLLYRADDSGPFTALSATPVETGDDVAFSHAAAAGLYTLGIGDIDFSTIGAIQVNSTADLFNAEDGLCTLREAIQAANDDAASGSMPGECVAGSGPDTIFVPAGIYTLELTGSGENLNQTGDLDILDELTIFGDGPATTIIQGATAAGIATDRVFHVRLSNHLVLSDLTIRYGVGPHRGTGAPQMGGQGGGIYNTGVLELENVIVTSNYAGNGSNGNNGTLGGAGGSGGAIYSTGNLTVTRSLLFGNRAGNGGDGSDGSDNFSSCDYDGVPGGTGGNGGAIVAAQGTLWIEESTLQNNQAGAGGDGGEATTYCEAANGGAGGAGGAIYAAGLAVLRMHNSTLSGNSTGDGGTGGDGSAFFSGRNGGNGGDGAALSLGTASNSAVLRNITLYGNVVGLGGTGGGNGGTGGSHGNAAIDAGSGSINLQNNILTNTGASDDCLGAISGSNNLVDDHISGACSGVSSAAVTNLDGALSDNGGPTPTHALADDSNAVDAGSASCPDPHGAPLATDQRGYSRPFGAACDIGAYEYVELATTDDAYQVALNTLLSVPAPGVLGNDPGYESGVYVVTTGGAGEFVPTDHGLLNMTSSGGFAYYPNPDFVGDDIVDVTITDGQIYGYSVMTITVTTASNAPPLAVDDVYTVPEDNELVVPDAGVLANDVTDDGLVAGLAQDVSSGVLALNPGGGFTYSPTLNFYGVITFTYRVTDTIGQTDEAISYILVSPVNDPPQAARDGYLVTADSALVAATSVLANDVDPEGNDMLATLVTDVATGTLSLNLDGTFTYTPTLGFSGPVTFTYEATDGEDMAQSEVTLFVDVLQITSGSGSDAFTWLPGLELYGSASPYEGFAFLDDDGEYTDTSGETRYYQFVDPLSGVLKWFGLFRFNISPGT
jgi:CSLREA domain-containing protein